MLETILEGLREVDGVQGALIIDHTGAVIAYRAHAIYDLSTLQLAARAILSATDSVALIQDDWDMLTTHFMDGKLVLRQLRSPGPRPRRHVLAVIGDQSINLAFLGVALRVAASKLVAALEAASEAATPSRAARPTPVGNSWTSSSEIRGEPSMTGTMATAGPMASGDSGIGTVVSDVAAVDAASAAFLAACMRALAARTGPIAKIFLRDAVRKVCPGRAFSRADGPALIAELSGMLASPEDRAMFQRAMRTV
jgi:predicted regulator of Ras-like GTPase activity (Roadblock/LC7/MglB family)